MASETFWEQVLSQPVRQASHVAHSINMVGELPGEMGRAQGAEAATVSVACLESFLVHVRLLAEFLLVHPADARRDFSAIDFGWVTPPPDDARSARMREVWFVASQHLVHFSRERAPEMLAEDLGPPEYLTASGLAELARSVLSLMEDFVQDIEAAGHRESGWFRFALDHAKEELVE